jgi:hypothetical protein
MITVSLSNFFSSEYKKISIVFALISIVALVVTILYFVAQEMVEYHNDNLRIAKGIAKANAVAKAEARQRRVLKLFMISYKWYKKRNESTIAGQRKVIQYFNS